MPLTTFKLWLLKIILSLKDCKKANLKGIVLKSNQNIFIDKKKCISFANKNNIFIKVI